MSQIVALLIMQTVPRLVPLAILPLGEGPDEWPALDAVSRANLAAQARTAYRLALGPDVDVFAWGREWAALPSVPVVRPANGGRAEVPAGAREVA